MLFDYLSSMVTSVLEGDVGGSVSKSLENTEQIK